MPFSPFSVSFPIPCLVFSQRGTIPIISSYAASVPVIPFGEQLSPWMCQLLGCRWTASSKGHTCSWDELKALSEMKTHRLAIKRIQVFALMLLLEAGKELASYGMLNYTPWPHRWNKRHKTILFRSWILVKRYCPRKHTPKNHYKRNRTLPLKCAHLWSWWWD